MILSKDTREAGARWVQQVFDDQYAYGYPGKPLGDNQFEMDVPGHPGMVYFRRREDDGSLTLDKAMNQGALPDPQLLVMARVINGVLTIERPVPQAAQSLYGKHASSAAVPPTISGLGTLNEDYIEGLRILPLGVQRSVLGGLYVHISAGIYAYQESYVAYGGDDVDQSSYLPGSGEKVALVIGIDMTTGAAATYDASPVGLSVPFTAQTFLDIAFPDTFLPLAGITLSDGQTGFTPQQVATEWLDLRVYQLSLAGLLAQAVILAPDSATRNNVTPSGDYPSLRLRRNSSGQSSSIQEWTTEASSVLASIDKSGNALVNRLAFPAATELTIASGVVTATAGYHTIDTEGDAASDDLDTINGVGEGVMLCIRAANTTRTVVVKNSTNIKTNTGGDITLDNDEAWVLFIGKGSGVVLALAGGSAGGAVDASAVTYTPDDTSNWNSSTDPGNANDAFDQLASRTKTLESGTPAGGAIATDLPNPSLENWSNGTSSAPDWWTLTGSGATVAREATTIRHGFYSAALTRSGTDCNLSVDAYPFAGRQYLRGRTVTFGAWVYATVASRARLRVYDGTTTTYSSYHAGGSAWEFLTVTVTIGGSASVLNCGLQVDSGNTTAYLDGATLAEGATATTYQQRPAVLGTLFDLRVPPQSPDALNDEFDDNTVSGSWTEWDYATVASQAEDARGLYFTHSGSGNAGLYKSLPSGDFSVQALVSASTTTTGGASYAPVGVMVLENAADSTKRINVYYVVISSTGVVTTVVDNYTNYSTFSATLNSYSIGSVALSIWLRIRRNGSNFYYDFSVDGLAFVQQYTGTLAYTPAHFGIYAGYRATTQRPYFHSFRYTSSDVGFSGIVGGGRVPIYG